MLSCKFVKETSWTLIKMRTQLVDGRKTHHAFGHLGLDRAIGIKRIGHSVDDAGLEHRHWRLLRRSHRRITFWPRRYIVWSIEGRGCAGTRRSFFAAPIRPR